MIDIQEAKHTDIDDIMIMCEHFYKNSGYEAITNFDEESMLNTLKNLLSSDTGLLFIAKDGKKTIGMVGALLYPFYFNTSHTTGQELFWWVDKDCRKTGAGAGLLDALESKARDSGAKSFTMIALESLVPEMVGNIYMKNGYRKSEHSYIKVL